MGQLMLKKQKQGNMKKYLLIVFVSVLGANCNSSLCKIDTRFEKKYKESIETAKQYYYSNGKSGMRNAFDYLRAVTLHDERLSLSYIRLYRNKNDLDLDVVFWNNWYEQNKCKMTIELADSLYNLEMFKVKGNVR